MRNTIRKRKQEEPGETKGDTEKLQCVWGGEKTGVFYFLFVHTNQNLPKKQRKNDNL